MKCGCNKSKIDGTERIAKANVKSLPEKFEIKMPKVLDQGNTMKCVAYSLHNLLNYLVNIKKTKSSIPIDDIYNSRSEKEGMSIKEALHYVHSKGIKDYARIGSEEQLKKSIIAYGPCLMALPVYSSNYDFWNGSEFQGYHCVLVTGYDKDGFTIMNSWGKFWGDGGYTYIKNNEMNKVLELWTII